MNTVDIAIVGAGLVGTPLARALAQQGWSVALLDARNNASSECEESASVMQQRCTALSLGTRHWFEAQGLWAEIAEQSCPIDQVHVSHKGYFGSTRLTASEVDAQAVGYVVSNEHLNKVLLRQLMGTSVRYIPNATVSEMARDEAGITIGYAQEHLTARLVIAADGVSSVVRQSAGIDTRQIDYEQVAVLGNVRLAKPHAHVAYERFTDSGPLALLPRAGLLMSFVDCIDPHEQDDVRHMTDAQYLQRLQTRFGYRLGQMCDVGPRFFTPLLRIEATEQIAERTVLLGNAMRLLHPVGGQGYNLAIRDVAELQTLLHKHRRADAVNDPGSASLLQQFVQQRAHDQNTAVQFTDVLARSFRGKARTPSHLRALGLVSLDTLSPLRRHFARRTMGIA